LRGADSTPTIRSMRELWETTRLRAEASRPAASSVVPKSGEPARWLDVLQDILSVGYGKKREPRFAYGTWSQSTRRTCPSAGALYPVDIIVAIAAHHPDGGNYLYSLDDGLVPYDSQPFEVLDFARLGLEGSPPQAIEAVIVLLARPWISMAKYGLRGYIYCHLDAGHAASNLGMYARALGADTRTHLRFSRTAVTDGLNLAGSCREPLIVLSLLREGQLGDSPRTDGASNATGKIHSVRFAAQLEPPSVEEQANWSRFNEITSYDIGSPAVIAEQTAISSAVDERLSSAPIFLPEPTRFPNTVSEVRAAIMRRRSAKGFEDASFGVGHLSSLLANLTTDLPSDCRIETVGLRLTLLARAIQGLEAGAYACDLRRRALLRHGATTQQHDFHAACMGQSLARTAAALVLFHVPISSLFAKCGTVALAESHFQAAQLAQQMYVTAARIGLGITCIGGFDEVRLAALANLPAREEIIYVVALGVANDRVAKEDRLEIAFSHGFDRHSESRPA